MRLIVSFSYRDGDPPADVSEVHDVRPYRNPHRNRALRALDGRDPRVSADVLAAPGVADLIARIIVRDPETVAIGCHAGRHRSVAIAEALAAATGADVLHLAESTWAAR